MSWLISTGARSGDIGIRTTGDIGTPHNAERDPNIDPASLALQICEIDLRLNPGALPLENVVLTINLTSYKGKR